MSFLVRKAFSHGNEVIKAHDMPHMEARSRKINLLMKFIRSSRCLEAKQQQEMEFFFVSLGEMPSSPVAKLKLFRLIFVKLKCHCNHRQLDKFTFDCFSCIESISPKMANLLKGKWKSISKQHRTGT